MREGTLMAAYLLRAGLGFVLAIAALLATGCQGGNTVEAYTIPTGGDASRGAQVIQRYNCGACHLIPGVPNARGMVGPPLIYFARRTFIAGEVPNNTENLVQWVRFPQSIEANTAMPSLGLSDQEARDIAAYLYTLH
jgi:cytochrome c